MATTGVPLLLLCTARPKLHERHPTWASSVRNAQAINLAPLIALLLQRTVLPGATQQALLDRAGGNPLYAEEFVRLLSDRNQLGDPLEEVLLPDSVQALIAARLDTLSAERKGLLQDASVIGKVFWAGALAAMGERAPREVELALHELVRKELVRPSRSSSMQGEQEYGFWHLLVRDVCYAQIPRSSRAARHRAAAAWIESQAGDRVDDLSDVLAYHYTQALELARAAGEEQAIPSWRRRRAASSPWPGSGHCPSTWPAPRRASPRRSSSLLRTTPNELNCSSTGLRQRYSRDASRRRGWRSRRRWRCIATRVRGWQRGEH